MNVEEAIAEIRRQAEQLEMIYYAYVLDDAQHLAGVVSFRELLSADRSKQVRDVLRMDFVSVLEDADKEEIAQLLARRRLLAVPVVDTDGRMLGIVSSADVVGAVQQAAGEDIQKIGGMEALEGPYLEVTFGQMVRKRAGWLAVLFLGEMLTATAMGFYEKEIARAVVLALFLPLIISSGGNSGSQATTLVIRAMALGGGAFAGLVASGTPRNRNRTGTGRDPRRDRHLPHFGVAESKRYIWPALHDDSGDYWLQPGGRGPVRDPRRLDVAVSASTLRIGPCECVCSLCRDPCRCDRFDYLFHSSEYHPAGKPALGSLCWSYHMARELRRKTPEELLRECQAEETAAQRKGHLKIVLGYASGVGKSFRMLDEARRPPGARPGHCHRCDSAARAAEVAGLLQKLEVIPLLTTGHGSAIDVEAILRRRPAVCVIDGLAYNNRPDSGTLPVGRMFRSC